MWSVDFGRAPVPRLPTPDALRTAPHTCLTRYMKCLALAGVSHTPVFEELFERLGREADRILRINYGTVSEWKDQSYGVRVWVSDPPSSTCDGTAGRLPRRVAQRRSRRCDRLRRHRPVGEHAAALTCHAGSSFAVGQGGGAYGRGLGWFGVNVAQGLVCVQGLKLRFRLHKSIVQSHICN